MRLPFKRKRPLLSRAGEALARLSKLAKKRPKRRKLPSAGYCVLLCRKKCGRAWRSARYASEDLRIKARKASKHSEPLLFFMVLVLGIIMVSVGGSQSFLSSLIALLLLILIMVIYMQMRFQKRMLDQYVPRVDFVRVRKCHAFSKRLRMNSLYGARDRVAEMRAVSHVRIAYDIVNDSFSPVSIQSAALEVKLRRGGRLSVAPSMAVLDVEPKRSGGTEVTFALPREVPFESIEWVQLELKGNCSRKVRMQPKLYVNLMIRGKTPEQVSEPYDSFRKRPEMRGRRA